MATLRLNNVENARRTLTTIIREYDKEKITEAKYRALLYGFTKLLEFLKVEKEGEFEKRLEALEAQLADGDDHLRVAR